MNYFRIKSLSVILIVFALLAMSGFAQKAKSKPIIFALINDGKTVEPIAYIDKKKLFQTVGGDGPMNQLRSFERRYYKAKKRYKLIFAGRNAGVVRVKSSNFQSDCSKNMAGVSTTAKNAKIKGFVMGLVTDFTTTNKTSGIRRLPTRKERAEFEKIIKTEFSKNEITETQLKTLDYHNLTAIDVDKSGKIILVGTFWVNTSDTDRALMFMIVDKEKSGKYILTHSEFKKIKQDEVMNGEIETIDKGVYHELLLDSLDYDNNGISEIFTMTQGFEGSTFKAYKQKDGKWEKVFETSNYHCGF